MPAYKYELKNGKVMWYANFYCTDWTGAKKHICKRGFKTQREAKEFERDFIDQQQSSSDIMFSALVEKYLEDMEHRLKPTTMENKRVIIEKKIQPYFDRLHIRDIDAIAVRNWQNQLISFRDEDGNPYSKTYLKTINNQLSAIMNYAVKHYGLKTNPCHAAGSIGNSHADQMQIWTRQEYETFIQYVQKPYMKLAFEILFYTGMRSGELLALTAGDILPDHRILINKNFATVKGEEIIMEPKTPKAVRKVAVPDFLYDEITEYLSRLYGIQPEDRIFLFTKSGLTKEFKDCTRKAGLKEIRLHDLRHSHASMLIEMGVAPIEISERLGHESVKTTLDVYSHLYPDKDLELASALNSLRNEGSN